MEIIEDWNKLPLSENLSIAMYGGEKDGIGYGYEFAKEAHMPKVENGYYIFKDNQLKGTDISNDSALLNRSSFNFEIAVYDCDADKIYYFKIDT